MCEVPGHVGPEVSISKGQKLEFSSSGDSPKYTELVGDIFMIL